MMRNLYRLLSIFLLSGLTSCSLKNEFDLLGRMPPVIEVSSTTAVVGEPVEVTIDGGFILDEKSTIPEIPVRDVSLGACFSNTLAKALYGLCAPDIDNPSIPPYLQALDGTTHIAEVGDIVVKRGQTYAVDHTFKITATKPGTVRMFADMQFLEQDYEALSDVNGLAVEVTFE